MGGQPKPVLLDEIKMQAARPNAPSVDLGSRSNSDNNEKLDRSKSSSNSIGKPLVRMYLHPYYLWSGFMIKPRRYLKQIPNKDNPTNFNEEQIDEWVTKIWPHLREFVIGDQEIQDIRSERIRAMLAAIVISSIIVCAIPALYHFSLIAAIGVGTMIYAIFMYIKYGDPDIISLNPHR